MVSSPQFYRRVFAPLSAIRLQLFDTTIMFLFLMTVLLFLVFVVTLHKNEYNIIWQTSSLEMRAVTCPRN